MKTAIAFTVAVLISVPALAQGTIFVVRHAERADAGTSGASMMATDPNLSDAGRARAEALASMLRDAKINSRFLDGLSAEEAFEEVARRLTAATLGPG